MSSHHFVKENQEPALIIANGLPCSQQLTDGLLEWSPFVVVLDGAFEKVLSLGIKCDALLGDFDRLDISHTAVPHQPNIEVIHAPDQNKTDLEKALDYLISKNHHAVNIIWATGLRLDHTFNNICTVAKYNHKIKSVLLDDYSKAFVLSRKFKKYYKKGQIVSLFALGKVEGITTFGLKYNLSDETLDLIERSGSSNESIETGIIEISHESGTLVLMECQD
jgi:thiamine pyrophosphokinase